MSLFQKTLEKKLSALLGARVTFESMKVSVLGGSLDLHGVTAACDDAGRPLLTVKRVRAEIALTRALSGEIAVTSLVIERPVVTVVRYPDGTTNLPPRPGFGDPTAGMHVTTSHDADGEPLSCDPPDDGPAEHTGRRWRFDAKKVLVVDGEAHFHDASGPSGGGDGYHLSADSVLAEVKHADGDVEVTLIVDSLGRRDVPVELGQVKATGILGNVDDLTRLSAASMNLTLDVGESLRVRVKSPCLRGRAGFATAEGTVDTASLLSLLPPGLSWVRALTAAAPGGRVELSARAAYDPRGGLRIPELTLRGTGITLGLGQRATAQPF